mmetsp:Transcript_11466/g.9888  ORF Transcript_11466/g.9888 Transcript_11466/m.9888 type:complete len:116 (+) Transcript_11466:140-487(+)|eukprot:CAMPEP_0114579016 /NCGR_PEP_ID=MMETSP0125-20121206/3475_1 /TAXON_ID=485358 ORGANISM="Aristerostoma sp., Strain ATCC 50986" /NCGR_SAMPLE_ID=MMETSP0125 /ASSEMBLY_ACC=CAM_ASM_000245 /LENGTH=115 /DNA_ID=CAMNT_0001769503 /DNA_START=472 /DNA_END=819 /DNA_ORIENTATION=+
MEYFLYNSYNDLLVEAETSTDIVIDDLQSGLDSNQTMLLLFTIISCALVGIYLLSTLLLGSRISDDASAFANLFFKINNQDVMAVTDYLRRFKASLKENYLNQDLISHMEANEEM